MNITGVFATHTLYMYIICFAIFCIILHFIYSTRQKKLNGPINGRPF